MIKTLLENSEFSLNNVWEGAVFLIPSLIEVYQLFQNSSTQISRDGWAKVDGIYKNCSSESQSQFIADSVFLGASVLLLIVFSFFVKRASFKRHLCHGRPGLLLPMGMLDSHDQIIEFTLAFLSVSEDIYLFIFGFKSDFGEILPIVKFFIKLIVVFALSLTSYLTFAGLHNRYLMGYIFGATISSCYFYGSISTSFTFSKCLTGTKIIPFVFSAVVYSLTDLSLLIIFIYKIVKHIRKHGTKMMTSKPVLSSDENFCARYVQMLLTKKDCKNEEEPKEKRRKTLRERLECDSLKQRIRDKIYKEIPGFSIPPRLMIGISVGLFFAYRIFIDQIYNMTPTIWIFLDALNVRYGTTHTTLSAAFRVISSNISSYTSSEVRNSYRYLTFFYVQLIIGCSLAAIVFGFLNSIVQSFLILRNYRLNFHKINMKGFTSIMELDQAPPPYALILGFVRFSGYQAAHILWGILVVFFVFTVLLYFIIGIFLLPLFYVDYSWSRRFVINYGPVILASMILNYIQTLIVKYIFVKEKGALLEIDNRRAFIIFCHCAFFLNAMVGLFTSIKRIIVWLFSGVICFSRIDFSSLPDYLHGCDSGYMCYIGFLYTEQYHHNPIMRNFVNILLQSRSPLEPEYLNPSEIPSSKNISFGKICKRNTRYINKWKVAFTLIRNQSLLLERK